VNKGFLVVLSSPSGGGKTTLREEILKCEKDICYSVSYTTRSPRREEVHGKDYYFVSREKFLQFIKEDRFIEWAEVHGNFYGTPKDFIEESIKKDKIILLDIDVQGARKIKKCNLPSVLIFLIPPSWEELKKRLVKRKTESETEIRKRLERAKEELNFYKDYDYLIVNRFIEEAVQDIRCIIKAEKCRRSRNERWVKRLILELS